MAAETEKLTLNLGHVNLGQIDLLVQEGFYSNRTDFMRTAIRNQLATHAEAVKQTVARKTLVLGLPRYTREDLEALRDAGHRVQINVLGLASIAEDVSSELALATIDSVVVLGAFRAAMWSSGHWPVESSKRRNLPQSALPAERQPKEFEPMDNEIYAAMIEATRFTHEGRLNEATQRIQRATARWHPRRNLHQRAARTGTDRDDVPTYRRTCWGV